MGEQHNLTEENVAELTKKLEEMKQKNPDLEYKFFKEKFKQPEITNDEVLKRIDDLFVFIKSIFDGHVLINGKFIKIPGL